MVIPSKKSPQMETFIDISARKMFGRTRTGAINSDMCVCCGGDALFFMDELSRREYSISGLCQKCQDKTFG